MRVVTKAEKEAEEAKLAAQIGSKVLLAAVGRAGKTLQLALPMLLQAERVARVYKRGRQRLIKANKSFCKREEEEKSLHITSYIPAQS